jgi:hypothetical protein
MANPVPPTHVNADTPMMLAPPIRNFRREILFLLLIFDVLLNICPNALFLIWQQDTNQLSKNYEDDVDGCGELASFLPFG